MSLYSFPNFIVSIYTLSLGSFVLFVNPRARINILYFGIALSSFVWLGVYGFMFSTTDFSKALLLGKIGHIAAITLTPIVYSFAVEVLGSYAKKIDILLVRATAVMASLCTALVFLSPLYFKTVQKQWWGYYPAGGPIMAVYTLLTFLIACRTIKILRDAAKVAKKELRIDQYQRFKYYSISITLFIFAAIDYLPKFGLIFYPFGCLFVALFSSLITYAIIRHQLFDIDVLIRRSFMYSSLVAIITLVYLLFIVLSENFFKYHFGYGGLFGSFIASCVVAVLFNPLRSFLQGSIDRYFFRIDPQEMVKENIQMKVELQKQDRLKAVATLAAGMAHEIKNPLSTLKTFSEYLPTKYDDPTFRSNFQRIVADEVDRVNNIIKQLLEFSKPETPLISAMTIEPILEDTLELLSNNLLKSKVEVSRKYGKTTSVIADKNQIRQVLLNLFLNAIQAMPSGGLLTVETMTVGGYVRTKISDTGLGISKQDLPHVFDPFYTTKEQGTGLGLSVAHGIIEKHGGKIELKSEVGVGTEISVFLKSQN